MKRNENTIANTKNCHLAVYQCYNETKRSYLIGTPLRTYRTSLNRSILHLAPITTISRENWISAVVKPLNTSHLHL